MTKELEYFLDYICFLRASTPTRFISALQKPRLAQIKSFYDRLELLTEKYNVKVNPLKIKFRSPTTLYESVEQHFLSDENKISIPKDHSDLFSLLAKNFDEDFYSDFISALLSKKNYQGFSLEFLKNICKQLGINYNPEDGDFQVSRREVYVGQFDSTSINKAMRMDILITTPADIFIIEAKTKTSEHDSQTLHYFNAVEKYYKNSPTPPNIHGLMLSLDNQTAEDPRYVSISYLQIFNAIKISLEVSSLTDKQYREIEIFYFELYRVLIKTNQVALERGKLYRSKGNKDVA